MERRFRDGQGDGSDKVNMMLIELLDTFFSPATPYHILYTLMSCERQASRGDTKTGMHVAEI